MEIPMTDHHEKPMGFPLQWAGGTMGHPWGDFWVVPVIRQPSDTCACACGFAMNQWFFSAFVSMQSMWVGTQHQLDVLIFHRVWWALNHTYFRWWQRRQMSSMSGRVGDSKGLSASMTSGASCQMVLVSIGSFITKRRLLSSSDPHQVVFYLTFILAYFDFVSGNVICWRDYICK